MMNARRGGGFEKVSANARVNQASDLASIDARHFDCVISATDTRTAGHRPHRPDSPMLDAAHHRQTTFGQLQPLVQRPEFRFDIVAGPAFRGDFGADRFQADVFKSHG